MVLFSRSIMLTEHKKKNREVMMELLQINEQKEKQASNYDDDKQQQA